MSCKQPDFIVAARRAPCGALLLMAAFSASSFVIAQVPPNIEPQLMAIGKIVDPACTAKLYRPLMPANDITSAVTPLYPGVTIARNLSFGPDAMDVVDIFVGDKGPASRPVLIYVPGGGGNKIELQDKEANAFYDNIGRWATKHGMIGVTMQRHPHPGWDGGAKDVSAAVQFLQANIAKYHGNPERMFMWAHSAGNGPVGTYAGRPELWGPKGVGIKGVIFMSAAPFDIEPSKVEAGNPGDMMKMFAQAGKTCGAGGPMSTAASLPGKEVGQPGGPSPAPSGPPGGAPPPGAAPGGGAPGGPPVVDAATLLARSSLPALKTAPFKIMIANAEYDLGSDPAQGNFMPFDKVLHDELCKSGPEHCPTVLIAKGHSHMSIVFSIDTPDKTVSEPILAWMKGVK
jgi:Carboxylesterase family